MRRHVVLVAAALLPAFCFTQARAADVYWDINGTTAGSGGATPSGSWDSTTQNWSTSSAGSVATQAWNPAGTDVAVFSAGSDATGAYTVTIDSQTASGLRDEDGDVTLSGGTLTLKTGSSINVLSGRTLTVQDTTLTNSSGETISKDGTGTLVLNGGNTLAGTFNLNTGTVGVGASTAFGGTTNTAGTATLNINGGSLSNTNTNAVAPIVNVVNSLTVNINGNFSVENSPQGNHLISFQTSALGAGKAVLTGNRTITVNQAPSAELNLPAWGSTISKTAATITASPSKALELCGLRLPARSLRSSPAM
jgi:autotransporter-associated beta strand protein